MDQRTIRQIGVSMSLEEIKHKFNNYGIKVNLQSFPQFGYHSLGYSHESTDISRCHVAFDDEVDLVYEHMDSWLTISGEYDQVTLETLEKLRQGRAIYNNTDH